MPSVREALAEAADRLRAVTETPEFEAGLLARHAWGWSRARLVLDAREPADTASLEPLIRRRLAAEPIAYILGRWEFFSIDLAVEPPLLVPRPETEHLVEAAIEHIGRRPARVLDLCTGTGCVAIAIARNAPVSGIVATDIHPVALRVAASNAAEYGIPLEVRPGDLYAALADGAGPFDVIVSNPPYVAEATWDTLAPDIRNFEDRGALLSGPDGLDCIRRIVRDAPLWLSPGGMLAVEIGEEQAAAARALFAERGFQDVSIRQDLAGHDRVITGVWGAGA